MMVSLFSVFDPSACFLMSNWTSVLLWVLVIFSGYWLFFSRYLGFFKLISSSLVDEFSMILGNYFGKSVLLIIVGLFMYILINNLFGLVFYVFTGTAHFLMTISLAFPVWLGLMVYGWLNKYYFMFAHLVPQGTPGMLLVFMVLVESVSNLIRPITLSVRLGANMIAGHLLLVLLGGLSVGLSYGVLYVVVGQLVLLVLEVAVAFIQAYVFVTLMVLYFSEV